MVCEEKVDIAGKLAWIEPEPQEQDAPISVWWDEPPAGEDDGYASMKAGIGRDKHRTPRS